MLVKFGSKGLYCMGLFLTSIMGHTEFTIWNEPNSATAAGDIDELLPLAPI
jgi:hypothetical protein